MLSEKLISTLQGQAPIQEIRVYKVDEDGQLFRKFVFVYSSEESVTVIRPWTESEII